jgi:hypothetical protein
MSSPAPRVAAHYTLVGKRDASQTGTTTDSLSFVLPGDRLLSTTQISIRLSIAQRFALFGFCRWLEARTHNFWGSANERRQADTHIVAHQLAIVRRIAGWGLNEY